MATVQVRFDVIMSEAENEACSMVELIQQSGLPKERRINCLLGTAKHIVTRYGDGSDGFASVASAIKVIETELKKLTGLAEINWKVQVQSH
ncbi:hypothetical protein A3758_16495 [Oleiphilus sp. HI0118]|nr:hypothetical protein A3758_04195 [Oleiphilus sp. HI0118]KZZ53375.1 hypothetical protein A3758_16495 [Oleiphilus sp. HI0118]KZZ79195.1 hypothetical protein A3767_17210 [Oleiphilus sp. HI0133]KZZ80896.1 hypothetical protein A3767_09190 [Oleiphilus sp. HI0133]